MRIYETNFETFQGKNLSIFCIGIFKQNISNKNCRVQKEALNCDLEATFRGEGVICRSS